MLLSIGYYRWGGWRRARMLDGAAREPVAMPAEVPAQPPAPLASLDPHDTQDGRRRAL